MSATPPSDSRPRLLVVELWGLGDLTFAIPTLRAALERYEVTVLAKEQARALLAPSFPELRFLAWQAPWTAFRGKYRLWNWNHREGWRILRALRRARFAAGVSVRPDPRDHALLRLAGVRRRFGFPSHGSAALLTDPVHRAGKQHRVEDWRQLREAMALPAPLGDEPPFLQVSAYRSATGDALFTPRQRPVVCLHTGARIPVRRWPHFAALVQRMRARFDFHLLLVTEPDGDGAQLTPLADTVAPPLALGELVDVLGRSDLVLCNDSGPMHIAASGGRPVVAMFGPGDPQHFSPWGTHHHVAIRDLCALRPCYDYCAFPEPYCLTRLGPEEIWPEIERHLLRLVEDQTLPRAFLRAAP